MVQSLYRLSDFRTGNTTITTIEIPLKSGEVPEAWDTRKNGGPFWPASQQNGCAEFAIELFKIKKVNWLAHVSFWLHSSFTLSINENEEFQKIQICNSFSSSVLLSLPCYKVKQKIGQNWDSEVSQVFKLFFNSVQKNSKAIIFTRSLRKFRPHLFTQFLSIVLLRLILRSLHHLPSFSGLQETKFLHIIHFLPKIILKCPFPPFLWKSQKLITTLCLMELICLCN